MRIGYLSCKICGAETNCVELVSGNCPDCAREKTAELFSLQREFDLALVKGDPKTAEIIDRIEAYQTEWGVRLKDAPSVENMRKVLIDNVG